MIFPALFTAAMSLAYTTDCVLMLGAYGWAFVKPLRKLWHTLTITAASVVVALVVGGLEALGLVAEQLELEGGFWDAVALLNGNIGVLGFAIVGIFGASWLASSLVYRLKRYDELQIARSDGSP
jgi:high-affinity nickel-transport protein